MSVNQARREYRKTGGAANSSFGTDHPHNTFSASAHRSLKKSNNAQGGQLRGNLASVNTSSSNSNLANGVRSVENGGCVQSTIHGLSHSSVDTPNDTSALSSSMTSDSTLPSTPAKGDFGKGFALQFGSINSNVMNGVQVPPRTTSAPPNLDEQKRDQAAPKQQALPKKDGASTELQPVKNEPHSDPKFKRNVQVTSSPLTMQSQKPSILPMGAMPIPMPMPMPMPFHQPPVPMQFGGPPNPQMQSQGVMQMPLYMANPPPAQQQVFMPGFQHPHLMQSQGIIHQGQSLGFNPQMGARLPLQPGGVGMNMSPQFNQQQAVKFGSVRKTVKITHPETHEELRLGNRDGGPPHAQRVPSYTPTHPMGYYPNSYAAGRPFYSAPGSHPLPSAQFAPRFNYPVSRALPTSFVNQYSNSFSNVDFVRDVHNILPPTQSASTRVTVKPAAGTAAKKGVDSNIVDRVEFTKDVEVNSGKKIVLSKSGHLKQFASINEDITKTETVKSDSVVDSQKRSGQSGQLQLIHQGNDSSSRDAADDSAETIVAHTPSGESASIDIDTDNRSGEDQAAEQYGHSLRGETRDLYDNFTSDNKATHLSENLSDSDLGTDMEAVVSDRPNSSPGSNRTHMESNKAKNHSGKKKRNELLQKANAVGTTSDLYMAYKGRNRNNEAVVTAEHTAQSIPKDTAHDESPKLEPAASKGNQGDIVVKSKKYSRDFLLMISEQCIELPEGLEVTPDIVDILIRINANAPCDFHGQGRGVDRSFGGLRVDRQCGSNEMMDVDRWGRFLGPHPSGWNPGLDLVYANNMMGFRPNHGVLRHPRGQGPIQHVGGIGPGPIHSMGFQGVQRGYINNDGDRWHRVTNFNKGLIPSPQIPLQAIHKAERKYEIGKVTDEEQAKQRRLKAILNKLTPQNFEKLFEQVKEVNIDNAVTLSGVISQIFDKALMEPTFCEMYANFCSHLAMELPDLSVENEKITFRRLLLNKCQEEFERGEREEEEANKAEGDGETEQSKRLKARRRMLGNIRLIGELYKKKMLTERIMHECIKKLLGRYQNPDEENIEALCKLMSTIGEMIDHLKAKEHMDAYFDIMSQLSDNVNLSSRVRFMLRDSIDLRKNKWQQRRKVEGPKKIEELHRDAAQERQGQTRSNRMNSTSRRGPILEYAPRGSVPSQVGGFRGGPTQARTDDRGSFENRSQRTSGDEGGGLAKGMANTRQTVANAPSVDLNGRRMGPDHGASRDEINSDYANRDLRKAEKNVALETVWPEERLRDMSIAAIKEYYSANHEAEVALCIKDMNASSFYPTVISIWVTDAFERKDKERDMLANLLVCLSKPPEGMFNADMLIQGFESVLANLEDTVNDAPRAPEFVGRIFGRVITENVITLKEACRVIHDGGEEPGRLLEAGLAADVLGSILEMIKLEKGETVLDEIRKTCDPRIEDFWPSDPRN